MPVCVDLGLSDSGLQISPCGGLKFEPLAVATLTPCQRQDPVAEHHYSSYTLPAVLQWPTP